MTARQLDIVADTALCEDPRLAPQSPRRLSNVAESAANIEFPRCSSSVDPRITEVNRRRAKAGFSHDRFCRLAGISFWHWRDLRRGHARPRQSTIAKLHAVFDAPSDGEKPPQLVLGFHRLVMVLLAREQGLNEQQLLALDFSVQRPANADWLRAVRTRQMAIYITAVELQIGNAVLGRALGSTRANIKYARDRIEDLRDQPDIDALIARVSQLVGNT